MNSSANPRPETTSRFIKEHEVTLTRLKEELAKAMIDAKLGQDGSLFVYDTTLSSPVWIEINPNRKRITFKTWDLAPPCSSEVEALRAVNDANAYLELVQFHFDLGKVWGCYWISYVDGISVRQFIKTLHWFDKSFREGMKFEPARV